MAVIIEAKNSTATTESKEEVGFTYCYSSSLTRSRLSELHEAWPELLLTLEKCGVTSCTLNARESLLTASITRTHSQDDKARRLLELLATTNVPPSLSIELALNDTVKLVKYEIIKIGLQEYGFGSDYGIDKNRFAERRDCLKKHYLEALEFLTGFHLYLGEDTITAVATESGRPSSQGLSIVRTIVEQRIRYGR